MQKQNNFENQVTIFLATQARQFLGEIMGFGKNDITISKDEKGVPIGIPPKMFLFYVEYIGIYEIAMSRLIDEVSKYESPEKHK